MTAIRIPLRRFRRARLTLTALMVVVGSLSVVGGFFGPAASADSDAPLQEVQSVALPSYFTSSFPGPEVVVDNTQRRVFVMCLSGVVNCGLDKSHPDVVALDENTGANIGSIWTGGSIFGYSLDEANHEWYQASSALSGGQTVVTVYDTKTLATKRTFTLNFGNNSSQSVGLYYSARDKVLYAALTDTSIAGHDLVLLAADPQSGSVLWQTVALGCTTISFSYGYPYVLGESQDGKHLYSACIQHGLPDGSNGVGSVVQLPLPSNPATAQPGGVFTGQLTYFPGIVRGDGGTLPNAVWVPSLDRMVALVAAGNGGWGAYVFDGKSSSYVAAPTLFATGTTQLHYVRPTLGVNPNTGRIYAQSFAYAAGPTETCKHQISGYNSVAEAESVLSRNASVLIPTNDDSLYSSGWTMGVDTQRNNLWLPYDVYVPDNCDAENPGTKTVQRMAVIHDALPTVSADQGTNPDSGTRDIPEVPGQTSTNIGVQASAYGVRYALSPSGTEGPFTQVYIRPSTLDCNVTDFYQFPAVYAQANKPSPPLPPQYQSFCNAGNRIATFAHVPGVSLDTSEVHAAAIAGDTNQETANDLQNGTNVSQPGPYNDRVTGYVGAGPQCTQPDPTDTQTPQRTIDSCSLQQDIQLLCSKAPSVNPPSGSGAPTTASDTQAQVCGYKDEYLSGQALPYTPAGCTDDGASPVDPQASHSDAPAAEQIPMSLPLSAPGAAGVVCNYGGSVASGTADMNGANVGLPVFAHDARAWSTVSRSTRDGALAESHAIVDGINVANVLHIGRIDMVAKSSAHGRPGTATATYTCTVSDLTISLPEGSLTPGDGSPLPGGVTAPTPPPSAPIQLPGTNRCDDPGLQADLAMVNQAFSGTLDVRIPIGYDNTSPDGPQGVVVTHTPKGYLGQVRASDLLRNSNNLLLNDQSIEQPGLVVTMIADSPSRHTRMVTTFGGVATRAAYGIFPLDEITDGGGDGGGGAGDGVPPSMDTSTPNTSALPTVGGPPVVASSTKGPDGTLGIVQRFYQAIVDGINILRQHPELIPPLIAVWVLLGLPGYLLSRRRALALATGGGI